MRRDADIGVVRELASRRVEQRGEAVDVIEETPLPRARRHSAEIAVRVENGKQRQPDPRRRARRCDRARHLGGVGIGRARRIVMEIMKLADAREAGLEHLGIGLRGDRRDILGRQPVEEAVHDLAPAPEIVVGTAATLRKSSHAALEAVAVDVAEAGQAGAMPFVGAIRCNARFDRSDPPVRDTQPHALFPAVADPCAFEPERNHHPSSYYV